MNRSRRCPGEAGLSPSPALPWLRMGLGLACGALAAAGIAVAAAPAQYRISQKNRAFAPASLVVQAGDTLEFVNDDGDLLHHAYLDSDTFRFDTGDQAPGSRALVKFTTKGGFTVLCGIHPRMKLVVQVR